MTTTLAAAPSTSIGIFLRVGSRYEPDALAGSAHFLEHMLFKGTTHRDARQIVWDVESLGGSINAFTSEDHTCYEASGPADLLPQLAAVLSDIVWHSTLPPEELEKERLVILEELTMYEENPGEHIDDLASAALWAPHPLGRPILGNVDSLAAISQDTLSEFYHQHYHRGSHVISVAGPQSHEEVLEIISPLVGPSLGPPSQPPVPFDRRIVTQPVTKIEHRDIEQTHLSISFHTEGFNDPQRHARRVFSTLFGETMSSRLFQTLREDLGLCYHVSSSINAYQDTGAFSIDAGLDTDRLEKALDVFSREIEKVATRSIPTEEVEQAKRYLCGQNIISYETTSSWMSWCGECLIAKNQIVDPAELRGEWQKVTPEEISRAAEEIFTAPSALAAISPADERYFRLQLPAAVLV